MVTLRESATKNAKIAETVLVAVSNLAYNNKRNSERFHAAGVCKGTNHTSNLNKTFSYDHLTY